MWNLPQPGIEPVSPPSAGRFLNTGPPGKSKEWYLETRIWDLLVFINTRWWLLLEVFLESRAGKYIHLHTSVSVCTFYAMLLPCHCHHNVIMLDIWHAVTFISFCLYCICGLPGGKESTCQCRSCRSHGFHPWVSKIPWRRKWQPTPVFLPGKFHGERSLAGNSP